MHFGLGLPLTASRHVEAPEASTAGKPVVRDAAQLYAEFAGLA